MIRSRSIFLFNITTAAVRNSPRYWRYIYYSLILFFASNFWDFLQSSFPFSKTMQESLNLVKSCSSLFSTKISISNQSALARRRRQPFFSIRTASFNGVYVAVSPELSSRKWLWNSLNIRSEEWLAQDYDRWMLTLLKFSWWDLKPESNHQSPPILIFYTVNLQVMNPS